MKWSRILAATVRPEARWPRLSSLWPLLVTVAVRLSETAAHLLSRKWRWLAADSTPGVRPLGALFLVLPFLQHLP